jgi:pantoate--beta-alanine ligase
MRKMAQRNRRSWPEMEVVKTIEDLRRVKKYLCRSVAGVNSHRPLVGFVPTMGNLHLGHVSLIQRMHEETDVRIVSIFVNPTQFGPSEDCAQYPRTLDDDLAHCVRSEVSLVFVPDVKEMYRTEAMTTVAVHKLTERFCGVTRPGHFDGVTLVVAKLFNIVQPDMAYFGQKDFQQFRVIEKMTIDLDFPVRLIVCPTIREADGLAMSSRNAYLTQEQRTAATTIYTGLKALEEAFRAGETGAELLKAWVRSQLDSRVHLEYLEIADSLSLEPRESAVAGDVVLIAARIGATRLIDNVILSLGGSNVR